MSLRARLTIFYTSLLGALLLFFGFAVYTLVSSILIGQIDNRLESASAELIFLMFFNEEGDFDISTSLPLDRNLIIKLVDNTGHSVSKFSKFSEEFEGPLDEVGFSERISMVRDVFYGDRHLRVISTPLESGDGIPEGVLQLALDIKEIDKAKQDLLQSLGLIGIGMLTLSAWGGWLTASRALMPLSIVTQTALEITRADDLSRRMPQSGPEGDEVGQLVQTFNQTLERLEYLFNSQKRFLADVSHELRTPLTVIKGNADLIRRMGVLDDESMKGIEKEIERLIRMVGDLLLLAQAESGSLPLDHNRLELDTILLEVIQQSKVLLDESQSITIGEIDQVLVCGDRDRLKQVVLNLVSNAVNHSRDGGNIEVRLWKEDQVGCLSIRDEGVGIPKDDLKLIFERFYRAEKSRVRSNKDGKGFGLGLSIANWIIQNHGGRIDVESNEGIGSTFTVRLPIASQDCQEVMELTPIALAPEHID